METSKDLLHLENIVNFCDEIASAISELKISKESFENSAAQKAVLAFFVEHIGEEAGKLSTGFTAANSEIEWKAIIGFRNRIVHAYTGIDTDVLWDTVENDIPALRKFCAGMLKAE